MHQLQRTSDCTSIFCLCVSLDTLTPHTVCFFLRLSLTCLPLSQNRERDLFAIHSSRPYVKIGILLLHETLPSNLNAGQLSLSFTVRCLIEKRAKSSLVNLSQKVNTGPDTQAQTLEHTHYNTAPRGLGHPADSILFPLNGPCVTKDNLASLRPSYLHGI